MYLLNNPKYFIFNLSWDESNPLLQDICKLYFCLPSVFRVDDLYDIPKTNQLVEYEMFGLMCYWGAHYVCYIKHEVDKIEFWENYDDTTIIRIKDWTDLIKRAIKSHLHPVVIIYRTKDNKKRIKDQNFLANEQEDILKFCKKLDEEHKITRFDRTNISMANANNSISSKEKDDDEEINNKYKQISNKEKPEKNDNGRVLKDNSTESFKLLKSNTTEDQWICEFCEEDTNKIINYICRSKIND